MIRAMKKEGAFRIRYTRQFRIGRHLSKTFYQKNSTGLRPGFVYVRPERNGYRSPNGELHRQGSVMQATLKKEARGALKQWVL